MIPRAQSSSSRFASTPLERAASWIFGALGLSVAVASFAYLVASLDRGFDLTDESFYLQWIDHPTAFGIAQSLFGYVLSPVYHLLGERPAALRRVGAIATALGAASLLWAIVQASREPDEPRQDRGFAAAILMACAAASAATYYCWWIATPSYNWLPLPAAFLLLIALLLFYMGRREKLSAVLTALAGVLAFTGKPTAGIAFLGVYLIGALLAAGFSHRTMRHLLISGLACVAMLAVTALTLVNPRLATEQLQAYVDFFGAAPAIGGIFIGWKAPKAYYLALLSIAVALSRPRAVARLLGALTLVAAALTIYQMRHGAYASNQGALVGTACLAVIANCLAWRTSQPAPRLLAVLGLAQVLPWLIAMGSGNGITSQSSFYVALPMIGALGTAVLCFGRADWRTMATGLAATLGAVAALLAANAAPYRLNPPLLSQDQPVTVGGGQLRVDAPTLAFVTTLRRDAAAAGFVPGTPVLDFSGDTPGIAVLLGGRSPVYPWLVGGYPFSERFAATIIAHMTPTERRSAWLVYSDAPRPFDIEFMHTLGFDLGNNYDLVSEPLHPLYGSGIRLYAPRSRVSGGR